MNCFKNRRTHVVNSNAIGETTMLDNNKIYREILNNSQSKVAVESTKTLLLLLICAIVNTYESFKDPRVIAEFIKAGTNFSIYLFLKKYCNHTKKCKILFKKELRMIISYVFKNTQNQFQIEDDFKFYFPEIDSGLIEDFEPIQEIILSNKNDELLDQAYEIIHNFFNTIMKNRAKQDMLKKHIAKFDDLSVSEKKYIKCIMSENFLNGKLLLIAVKSFMMHPQMLKLTQNKNKCCISMNEFILSFKNEIEVNAETFKHIGPNLANNFVNFGEKENFMTVLSCLICIKFDANNNRYNKKFRYRLLYPGFFRDLKTANFLESAIKCHKNYQLIAQFLLDCKSLKYERKKITKSKITSLIKTVKIFVGTSYFKNLVVIYDETIVERLKEILNEYLERIVELNLI